MGQPDRRNKGKHEQDLPSPRKIRRSCQRELYRTVKRLAVFIPPDKMAAAEKKYYQKVIENLLWIAEHGSNRRLLADWWADNVAQEIAELWQVDKDKLTAAFRSGFGG